MGKSIRSKRKKRLRTLKREIVEPHYDAKDVAKLAIAAAAMAAPKIELPTKAEEMEDDSRSGRRRSGVPGLPGSTDVLGSTPMDCEVSANATPSNLKASGGISKRGKSKDRHKVKKKLKSKRKKNVNF